MIPRHLLDPDDYLWALDHSRRRYRVIPLDLDEEGLTHFLRVVPLDGAEPETMAARCELFPEPWENSDRYASARMHAISIGAAARLRGGAR